MKPQAIIAVVVLAVAVGAVVTLKHLHKSPRAEDPPESAATSLPAANLPRLLDLGSGKCIPCKLMAPILEELKVSMAGKLNVEFIDIYQNPDAAKRYNVSLIPLQIFFDAEGKELFRHEGFLSREDIIAKWKELGLDLEKGQDNAKAK